MNFAYFIYKNELYQFDIDLFNENSTFFSRRNRNIKENEKINLLTSFEQHFYFTEAIQQFIQYFTTHTIQLTNINVFPLNYLSKKYEISSLEEITEDYINNNHNSLINEFLSNEDRHYQIERILSKYFFDFIRDDRLFLISTPRLYRILHQYLSSRLLINDQEKVIIIDFLFDQVSRRGIESSILFILFDFWNNEYFQQKIMENVNKIDTKLFQQEIFKVYSKVQQRNQTKERRLFDEITALKSLNEQQQIQFALMISQYENEIQTLKCDFETRILQIEQSLKNDIEEQINIQKVEISDNEIKHEKQIEKLKSEMESEISNEILSVKNTIYSIKYSDYFDDNENYFNFNELKGDIQTLIIKGVSYERNNDSLNNLNNLLSYIMKEQQKWRNGNNKSIDKIQFKNHFIFIPAEEIVECIVNNSPIETVKIRSNVLEFLFDNQSLDSIDFIENVKKIKNVSFEIEFPSTYYQSIIGIITKIKNTHLQNLQLSIYIDTDIELNQENVDFNEFSEIIINPYKNQSYLNLFKNCSKLSHFIFSRTVSSIEQFNIQNFSEITKITIPNTVKSIDKWSFSKLTKLKSISIPSTVLTIGDNSFEGCSDLKEIIINPSKRIQSNLFKSCQKLTHLIFDLSVSRIQKFDSNLFPKLREITIPSTVTSIDEYSFDGFSNLVKITIPPTITTIKNYTFRKCTSLKEIEIPNSIDSIGNYSFSECTSLEHIFIPMSVNNIGENAFSGCASLKYIFISSSNVKIGKNAFQQNNALKLISLPQSISSSKSTIGIKNYLKIIINNDFSKALCDFGYDLYKGISVTTDKQEAFKLFQLANENGDSNSLFYIAYMKDEGIGTSINKVEAIKYYKMSIESGSISAMNNYASLLYNGDGVPVNKQEAFKYYKMAADKGHVYSMFRCGYMQDFGEEIPVNKQEAIKYYKMAIDEGNTSAAYYYALLLDKGDGIESNKKEAAKYYKISADNGNSDAMYKYGLMLDKGDGIGINKKEAAKYYQKAADKGNPDAMYKYGLLLYKGEGVSQNKKEAAKYYKMSAEKGNGDAMYNYGLLLNKGEGVSANKEEAINYYRMAIDKGNPDAMYNYGLMLEKGDGVEINKQEAIVYYKRSAEKGNINAMLSYAGKLFNGEGTEFNKAEAIRLYIKAANLGNSEAIKFLEIYRKQ